ncbi:MAG: hydrolase 1, exosortase A system-associated [Comamonadaceae bacterium]|nr:hydrolase 1, exosortase A system-associated [Comamonadaceae bacterium]
MLGIISLPTPEVAPTDVSILIVVGGAQYRVGSHRQFVALARRLASAGHAALRFDFPGMGDSPGAPVSFEDTHLHIAAALAALQRHGPAGSRMVLWGLCDGASASLLYLQAQADPRVAGLVLLNPWIRSEHSLAQAQVRHYYRHRVLQADFWRKLLRGGIGWAALHDLARRLYLLRVRPPQAAHFATRMAQGLAASGGPVLILLSAHDLTAQEFSGHTRSDPDWQPLLARANVTVHPLEGADHTLSAHNAQNQMETVVLTWLGQL